MTTAELQKQVMERGSYRTAPGDLGRRLPSFLASPMFHIGLIAAFIKGNRQVRNSDFEMEHWADFCRRMLRLTEWLGGDVRVTGFEKLKGCGFPVVWASNHMSPLETYLLPLLCSAYSRVQVILKESLAHYPLFGRIVRSVDPIRLERKSALADLRKVLTDGEKGLRNGRSVLVFPQGQRLPDFDPATFNSMGVKLARRAGVPLVPVAVRTDFLRLGRIQKDLVSVQSKLPIHLACGDPIPPDLHPEEMHRASIDFISERMAEWGRETGTPLLASSV